METHGFQYVIFGGIAVWAYGRQRNTKDIDILMKAEQANDALLAFLQDGWTTKRTDEAWLFQATKEDVQVDLIFQAKGDFSLTDDIIRRARILTISDYKFKVISPEDLILIKMHAIKEIRPQDWYDAVSVIKGIKGNLDWDYIEEKGRQSPERVLSFLLFSTDEGAREYIPRRVIKALSNFVLEENKVA